MGRTDVGKSTLFKSFAKQIKLTVGQILYNNLNISEFSNKQFSKKISLLFQQNKNLLDLTVKEILCISRYAYLNLFEKLGQNDRKKIQSAMQLTNIKKFQNIQLKNLSSGQKQLVWIALLLAQDAQCMFLDQPTTFLDLQNQFQIMDILKNINIKLNKTIIIIIHDINIAAQYADVIFLMKNGKIIKTGSPKQVLTQETIKNIFNINVKIFNEKQKILICPLGKNYKYI